MWSRKEIVVKRKVHTAFAGTWAVGTHLGKETLTSTPMCMLRKKEIRGGTKTIPRMTRASLPDEAHRITGVSRVDISLQDVIPHEDIQDSVEQDTARLLAFLTPKSTAELSVSLVSDKIIRDLNLRWRGIDLTTDVLSFEQDGASGEVLGDIVVSMETAKRAADERGISLNDELRVLLLHGVLHLLGFDHQDDDERHNVSWGCVLANFFFGDASNCYLGCQLLLTMVFFVCVPTMGDSDGAS